MIHQTAYLLDVLLELRKAGIDELLLGGIELAEVVDLVDTVLVKSDLGSKVFDTLVLEERGLDEGGCGLQRVKPGQQIVVGFQDQTRHLRHRTLQTWRASKRRRTQQRRKPWRG